MFARSAAKLTQSDPQDALNVEIQSKQGKLVVATAACLFKPTAPSAAKRHFSVTTAKTAVID